MLLAIDGGGTKTHILVTEDDGIVIAQAQAGPLSLEAVTHEEAKKNLFEAISLAKEKSKKEKFTITKTLIGLAGVDTDNELKNAKDLFQFILKDHVSGPIHVVNDTKIALASGSLSNNAIILIAGTGSNCVGYNSFGETAKAGGLGYLLSDEGSGFYIGNQILRFAVQSADGRSEKTVLEEMIKDWFEIGDIRDLKEKINIHNFKKTTISSLSILLPKALEKDDKVAKKILESVHHELSLMVFAVANKLNFNDLKFDLVLAGSLFSKGLVDISIFENQIKKNLSNVNCILPKYPPVYGALKLLLQGKINY